MRAPAFACLDDYIAEVGGGGHAIRYRVIRTLAATRDATVMLTMTSDPDLVAVIGTDAIKDAAGRPVAPERDECLRDAIDSLALPPLGKGRRLKAALHGQVRRSGPCQVRTARRGTSA